MGCDIHAAIEFRAGEDSGWEPVKVPNPYFGKYGDEKEFRYALDIDRDYDLFAILGNVRNGYGFAGIDTGDGFVPMSDRRGYPTDMSPEVGDEEHGAMSHEHSATWVTLAEILAYDWTRTTTKRGVVGAVQFEEWDRMKEWRAGPTSYSGDVFGHNIKHVTQDEMRELVRATVSNKRGAEWTEAVAALPTNVFCRIAWKEGYAEAGAQLWSKVLPLMLKLGNQHGYANVRLVMDFDS